ncbi:hypothetical protein K456DRAFT_1697613 [Colletotrichum gloeosporioides 23]|nr:hypothetical protein K456DRAFT_1697613 [Colletotrichum gloeosporioides 23]
MYWVAFMDRAIVSLFLRDDETDRPNWTIPLKKHSHAAKALGPRPSAPIKSVDPLHMTLRSLFCLPPASQSSFLSTRPPPAPPPTPLLLLLLLLLLLPLTHTPHLPSPLSRTQTSIHSYLGLTVSEVWCVLMTLFPHSVRIALPVTL